MCALYLLHCSRSHYYALEQPLAQNCNACTLSRNFRIVWINVNMLSCLCQTRHFTKLSFPCMRALLYFCQQKIQCFSTFARFQLVWINMNLFSLFLPKQLISMKLNLLSCTCKQVHANQCKPYINIYVKFRLWTLLCYYRFSLLWPWAHHCKMQFPGPDTSN